MRRFLALSSAIALTVMMSSFTYAQDEMVVDPFPEITIELGRRGGTTGDELDDTVISGVTFDMPSQAFNVVEDERTGEDRLTITVVGGTGLPGTELNNSPVGTAFAIIGFGIDSATGTPGTDLPSNFDSALNESVTFAFNQDLFITAIDLNSSLLGFSIGESFEVGGIEIDGNNPGDIFDFTADPDRPEGLFVAAGDGVLFRALNGSGNIDSLTVQIAPPPAVPGPSPTVPEPSPAVPEPSTAVLLVSLGMIGVARRRRK